MVKISYKTTYKTDFLNVSSKMLIDHLQDKEAKYFARNSNINEDKLLQSSYWASRTHFQSCSSCFSAPKRFQIGGFHRQDLLYFHKL